MLQENTMPMRIHRDLPHTDLRVISEIQRAKFGVLFACTFGGKIWGLYTNFRGKFWGQLPNHLIWKSPPETWDTRPNLRS